MLRDETTVRLSGSVRVVLFVVGAWFYRLDKICLDGRIDTFHLVWRGGRETLVRPLRSMTCFHGRPGCRPATSWQWRARRIVRLDLRLHLRLHLGLHGDDGDKRLPKGARRRRGEGGWEAAEQEGRQ